MPTPTGPRSAPDRFRVGTTLGAFLLVAMEAPLAFVTLVQLMPREGPHEVDAAVEFALLTKLGIGWAVLVVALALPFVRTRRLRPWWYAPPLAMLAALAVRLLVFPPYGS
ncbi:hypothetical protein [Streptomyces sp. NPDC048638]|uniref:hypothetical protein n=1 Tax=Streptomyces sp. NPDC048638 TaxID=3365580 RepID=UPI003719AAC0